MAELNKMKDQELEAVSGGYGDIGKVMGFIVGRFVERHWINFKPLKHTVKSAVICAAGLVIMALLKQYVSPVLVGWLGSHWGKLLFSVIYTFYYIALFPLILKLIGKQEAAEASPAEESAA